MGRNFLITSTALLALTAGAAGAQDTFLNVVIFANLEEVAAERTGTTVTVVTEEDLATQSIRVAETLSRLPGLNIRPSGGLGTTTGFSLRGAPQGYVAVRIDGIDVSDPSGTRIAYDFGSLIGGGLSRIEVTPGAQTARFGGNAVGGAINLTSRQAVEDGWRQYVDGSFGSYATRALTYGLTWRDARADLALTLAHVASDGFSAIDNPGFTEADGFEGTRLSLNGGYEFDSGLRLSFAGFGDEVMGEFDGYDAALGGSADNDARTEAESSGLRLSAEFSSGAVDHRLNLTRYRIARDSIDGDTTRYTGSRNGFQYQAGTDLTSEARMVFGFETTVEDYTESGPWSSDSGEAATSAAFAELTWAVTPGLDLSASLRHDDHSEFGGYDSARLALAWRPDQDWILRAQAGSGFRAPSLFDLYSTFYGDPTLHPETSHSLDFGVERRIGADGFLRATAFWLEVEDLIGFDPVTYRSAQTGGTTSRSGLEIVADLALTDRLRLSADYTHTASRVAGDVAWSDVPRDVLGLGLAAQLTDRTAGRFDIRHVAGRASLPDYTLADLTVTHDLSEDLGLFLRVENVFDEQYHLVSGWGTSYGTPDRSIHAGFHARF